MISPVTSTIPTVPAPSASDPDRAATGAAAGAVGDARRPVRTGPDDEPLTREEQVQLNDLRARDTEVKAHEQAHRSAGGAHVTGGPTYTYQTGPDGRRYAVGGEVGIDASPEDDPEATIRKMETVRAAALAPASPSAQDQRVAAKAARQAAEARAELRDGDDGAEPVMIGGASSAKNDAEGEAAGGSAAGELLDVRV